MLWTEIYKPLSLGDITTQPESSQILQKLSESENVPHILLYGPSGSGKTSLTQSFLAAIYGKGALQTKAETKTLKVSPTKTIEFETLSSIHHIQMNPSLSDNYDKNIVQHTLKEMASTASFKSKNSKNFKTVVIDQTEDLSKTAQHSLR
ncbi:hypothetical protein MHBO_002126, partial [Bonamia ostreae]